MSWRPGTVRVWAAAVLCLTAVTLPHVTAADAAHQQRTLAAVDSLWTAGQVDSCWTRLAAEIEIARAAGDSTYLLDLLARRGPWRARLGQVAAAEPDLREAVALAERLGAGEPQRQCLRWLGFSLYRLGRSPEAGQCWEHLLDLARTAGDGEHEAWARSGLALQHEEAGRPRRALEEYEQALALFRARNDARGAAYVLNSLGTACQALGRYDEAIIRYRQAAEMAHELPWAWLEAAAQNNVAVLLYSLGDPGQARDLFRHAVELHRAAGDAAEEAQAGVNAAICEAALGRFEEAATELEQIREMCRRLGIAQHDGQLCNVLAGIRHQQGRSRLAARLHRQTLAADPPAPAKERLEALLALSWELSAMDSIPAALLLLRQASPWVEELENPRFRLEYRIELGRQYVAAGRAGEAWPLLLAAAHEAERLGLGGLRLPALAAAARSARALGESDSALVLLRAATAAWEAERGLPVDPEWREMRGSTATEIRVSLGSLLLEHPPDLPATERARVAFDAVQAFKARTLLERMTGPPRGEVPALALTPVACTQLQSEVLRPGELLLDFHLGTDESLLFAVTTAECRAVRLPGSRDFADEFALYVRMISAPQRAHRARDGDAVSETAMLGETRGRLRDLLLDPVEDLIATSRSLIVSPDGVLQRVSFAALLESPPASASAAPVIQTVPSVTIFARLRGETRAGRAPGSQKGTLLALAGDTDASGEPLVGARGEVRDLAEQFRHVDTALPVASDSLTAAPGGAAVLDEIRRYELLHLASHTAIEDEHPWRSRIRLSADRASGEGISLTAADIAHSRLAARLVVLSSCRSAGGRLLSGEGVQSLAGSFLVAGVPAVVATLWPVDDTSTRVFMRRFYEHLAGGAAVAEALARAQADARDDPRLHAPYHWAGFVVIGDGDLRVPLERRSRSSRVAGPLALVLLGVLAVLSLPLTRVIRRR